MKLAEVMADIRELGTPIHQQWTRALVPYIGIKGAEPLGAVTLREVPDCMFGLRKLILLPTTLLVTRLLKDSRVANGLIVEMRLHALRELRDVSGEYRSDGETIVWIKYRDGEIDILASQGYDPTTNYEIQFIALLLRQWRQCQ
jgi:hypothetical protein